MRGSFWDLAFNRPQRTKEWRIRQLLYRESLTPECPADTQVDGILRDVFYLLPTVRNIRIHMTNEKATQSSCQDWSQMEEQGN